MVHGRNNELAPATPPPPWPANQYKVSYDYVANFTAAPQLNSNSG